MKKITLLSVLIILISLSSCYKEGPTGPMGPQGNNGYNGQDGQDGEDGAIPKVYYFDMQLNQYTLQSYNSSWVVYGYINSYTITDNDLVYAYAYLSSDGLGDNYWQALPFNEYMDNYDVFLEHSFGIMDIDYNDYLKGDIMFSMRKSDSTPPYGNMNSTAVLTYKVIIVRGVEGKKAVVPESVNTKNIYELEDYLNIKHGR